MPRDAEITVYPPRELKLQNGGPQNRWSGDSGDLGVHLYCAIWKAASFPVSNLPTYKTSKLCADFSRKTPVAWLHRALWVYFPNGIAVVDNRLFGGRVVRGWNRSGSYVLKENHPLVLVSLGIHYYLSRY